MCAELSDAAFARLRKYIETKCGIALTQDKAYLVESRLTKLVVEHHCDSFERFYDLAVSKNDPKLDERIVDAMTTHETLWFRDGHPFVALSHTILPELLSGMLQARKESVRIWSAACSTGQEPYSVAILVLEMLAAKGIVNAMAPRFEILATDISPSALFIAQAATYNQFMMRRGMRPDLEAKYFTKTQRGFTVNESVRKLVKFQKFNLQHPLEPLGRFDLVLCRNVAIYFSESFKRDLFQKISRALTRPGYFFLGASESLLGLSDCFRAVTKDGGLYYKLP